MSNEESNIQARDRGYKDGEAGIMPAPEDASNEAYADGYRLGITVHIDDILKGKS